MILIICRLTYQLLDPVVYGTDSTDATPAAFYVIQTLVAFTILTILMAHYTLRRKVREMFTNTGERHEIEDCVVTLCCEPCSLYQMAIQIDDEDKTFTSEVCNVLTPPGVVIDDSLSTKHARAAVEL